MPARDLPNLGLKAFYDLGEDGWGDDMSLNLLKLSILSQATVSEKTDVEPVEPDPGTVIVLDETNATNPNAVAVFDGDEGEEAWVYFTPSDGWLLYDRSTDNYLTFEGGAWTVLEAGGGGGLPDAPVDGKLYGRKDADWAEIPAGEGGGSGAVVAEITDADSNLLTSQQGQYLRFSNAAAKTITVQPEATEALPENGEWHLRNVGAANLTIVAGSGVTINPPADGTLVIAQGGTVTIKRVAEDEFDLLGQTVAA